MVVELRTILNSSSNSYFLFTLIRFYFLHFNISVLILRQDVVYDGTRWVEGHATNILEDQLGGKEQAEVQIFYHCFAPAN